MEIQNKLFLIGLFLLAFLIRFYNLNWGAPYYFHPDERNIASSVSQLSFPQNLHPHFFAYGSFPLYSIYAGSLLWERITNSATPQAMTVRFETAIQVSRFFSAIFSVLLLILLYKIAKLLASKTAALIAFTISAFCLGFIQYAHFGTFELWLTFLVTLVLYLFLLYLRHCKLRYLLFSALVTGLLISIKVSSLPFLMFPILAIFFVQSQRIIDTNKLLRMIRISIVSLFLTLITFMIAAATYIATSPLSIFDYSSFRGTLSYESAVALGTIRVFYTESFIHTLPLLFQFTNIYPFLLGPFTTSMFIPAFFTILCLAIRNKNISYAALLIFFLIIFLSQALLFVKWTRYMVPTLPFIVLIIALAWERWYSSAQTIQGKTKQLVETTLIVILGLLVVTETLQGLAYFMTVQLQEDTRVAASEFAKPMIPNNAPVLSEVFDMGIVPFNNHLTNITLFNFYDLDFNPEEHAPKLQATKDSYDYIILPSQRLYKTRLRYPKEFPRGYAFYANLFSGNEYTILYETPCDSLCRITYLGNPKVTLEDTSNVFDHPPVVILKKRQK